MNIGRWIICWGFLCWEFLWKNYYLLSRWVLGRRMFMNLFRDIHWLKDVNQKLCVGRRNNPVGLRFLGKREDVDVAKLRFAPFEPWARTLYFSNQENKIITLESYYFIFWRKREDSNLRNGCPLTRFPSVRLQPLGHTSSVPDYIIKFVKK